MGRGLLIQGSEEDITMINIKQEQSLFIERTCWCEMQTVLVDSFYTFGFIYIYIFVLFYVVFI